MIPLPGHVAPTDDEVRTAWRLYGWRVMDDPDGARRGVVRIMLVTAVLGFILGATAASAIWMAVT